ncbi:ABC transporter permease [Chryseobacterium indoltheticum]|uniref:Transport permease protein n=1 Tax=Chryseobacterium indoltheticum TaxID=254 RepID=A0A381FL57_9FLAO|nr:ABC transporter permease [Chryseobacterium indoltheticum]AZA61533.1 ABC transporter permease [Chryseobacterium indoltheticum]AZA72814.1 ABC transporter permease [Chryseobacterium indoltheticum]QQQ26791.1 ABC transporter permease [Chryseobacterium indoltheticum]SIP87242.1 lipopolysaccharide transport system permease protein [Chryseobacterium indoltheticum]SUX42414.1 ABC-2 type transporter [Chryseobacterium indoltheticum]
MSEPQQKWTDVIESKHSLFQLNLKEVWQYRDLVFMFVKRDFISSFKQTILGPLWFFINPILTTIVFTLVFGGIANLPTDGIPPILFYLAGNTLWGYFSTTMLSVSNVFTGNAGIFGKVYFPRLATPISTIISSFMRLSIQLILFFIVLGYYIYLGQVHPNYWAFFFPVLVIFLALFSLGLGMIFSSLTTKYRDLSLLLGFGVSLFMWFTPVILPTSLVKQKLGNYGFLADLNPLTPIFECFKFGFIGSGDFNMARLLTSFVFIILVLLLGIIIFNKSEKSFIDTV